jgi:hypothetical protein
MTIVDADGWIVIRNRVSLAGRVTAASGDIASGGALSLTAAHGANRHNAKSPPHGIPRRYDTRIRPDGFYFFLDLPAGDYVLNGQDERGDEIEAKQVSIPPAQGSGPLHIVGVDLSSSTRSGRHGPPPKAQASARPGRPGTVLIAGLPATGTRRRTKR